jgi:hypothetical protein
MCFYPNQRTQCGADAPAVAGLLVTHNARAYSAIRGRRPAVDSWLVCCDQSAGEWSGRRSRKAPRQRLRAGPVQSHIELIVRGLVPVLQPDPRPARQARELDAA